MNNFYLPENVFAKLLFNELSDVGEFSKKYLPSALISQNLKKDDNSIGIIPTLDLIHHPDFYVSSKIGISFNALLSNSYLHFRENQFTVDNLYVKGDVSSNEVILSKIFLKEMYDLDITPRLATENFPVYDENVLIVGDENFKDDLFLQGLSFSEEIIELIEAPYVNFILASKNEKLLKQFTEKHRNDFLDGHPSSFSDIFSNFGKNSFEFIQVNLQHVIFDFEEQDLEGIKILLQLPYYHGLIDDMIDLKFV
ncbi:MAG: hypothetical protein NZM09_07620 [Ignavibacterium sp.]|nr:hypothetical protein [Ignavibacterium sp.]MCX7610645.1 hypothetical protein [Ignavibacterium sp.]MDW8375552.1 hypothetical protein [Ignavibacteriales bacterium]